MAGSEYEIELFGKKLIYSEGKLRDIKLHFFMDDLYELIKMQVGQLFDNAGDLNGLLYTTNEDITEIYVTMYDVTIQYIEKNVLKGIEAKEIFLTPGEEPLRKKYKHWNQEIRQRENEAKRKMKEDGLPYEEQMHRFAEYAQREFEDMKYVYVLGVINDIVSLRSHVEELFMQKHVPIEIITDKDQDEAVEMFTYIRVNPNLENKAGYVLRILNSCPVLKNFPAYTMNEFPDQMDKLLQLFTFIGASVPKNVIESALKSLYEKLPHDTEAQTLKIKQILDNVQNITDIQGNVVVGKINKLIAEFDLQARSFQGIEYPTREARKKAEDDYNILNKKYREINSMNEGQCNSAREWIISQSFDSHIAQMFLLKMDNRIQQIWEIEDSEKFSVLFQNVDIHSEESKNQAIKIIGLIGKSADKNRYIDAINGMNAENISIFQKYEKWKKKSIFQKYGIVWGLVGLGILILMFSPIGLLGIAAGCIVHYLQKKEIRNQQNIWNLLTVDGKIVHKQLLEVVENNVDNLTADKKEESQC